MIISFMQNNDDFINANDDLIDANDDFHLCK